MWAQVFSPLSFSTFGVALAAALTGSLHCLGMCGPLRFIAGRSLHSSLAYQLGRLFAYLLLGLFAGLFGAFLSPLFLIGLIALTLTALVLNLGVPMAVHSLRSKAIARLANNPFFLGLGTGLLPCGLLYGWIAAGAATQSPLQGSILLLSLWLGTVPILEAGSSFLRKPFGQLRHKFPKAVPISFLLLALLPVIARLAAVTAPLAHTENKIHGQIPYCHGSLATQLDDLSLPSGQGTKPQLKIH